MPKSNEMICINIILFLTTQLEMNASNIVIILKIRLFYYKCMWNSMLCFFAVYFQIWTVNNHIGLLDLNNLPVFFLLYILSHAIVFVGRYFFQKLHKWHNVRLHQKDTHPLWSNIWVISVLFTNFCLILLRIYHLMALLSICKIIDMCAIRKKLVLLVLFIWTNVYRSTYSY